MQDSRKIEVQGQRVLTTEQLAKEYEVDVWKIRQNFKNNKERYVEGKHYIELRGKELVEFRNRVENFYSVGKTANKVHFWTEKGALLHAKSLNTEKAWEVYDYLVDFYFRAKEEKQETDRGQQVAEKNAVVSVKTGVEKIPEGIEEKIRTVYRMGQLDIEVSRKTDIFVKLIHLVEKLRGEVHFVTFKSKSEGMMVAGNSLSDLRIGIRSEMDFDKYIYNIAYEVAHYFLHYDKGDTVTSARHKEYEEQADRCAKMLLVALAVEG